MSEDRYYVASTHSDETSYSFYSDQDRALKALAKALGRETHYDAPLEVGKRYIDDYGGVRRADYAIPGITTARQMESFVRAWNSRECNCATKAQLRLLHRCGF